MAGGIGSRFWPLSKNKKPKQFLDILGTGRTLLQQSVDRFASFIDENRIYVSTNENYVDLVKEQLPDLHERQILVEPIRKNTAPCVLFATNRIASMDEDANMVISPSDHIVLDRKKFKECIMRGFEAGEKKDILITLGIKPTRPDTGYGYIQYHDDKHEQGVHKVKTFTEKPTLDIAKTFMESGDFLWNAGIFIWNVKTIQKAFHRHLPEMYELFGEGKKLYNTPRESEFINKVYATAQSVSIDIGVMEKAKNVCVIPSDFGWSDLGTWASLYESYTKDYFGNAVSGKNVMIIDSTNNMVMMHSNKLAVLHGLDDFIVVDTDEALLICPKSKEQEIKQIVADIKRQKGERWL